MERTMAHVDGLTLSHFRFKFQYEEEKIWVKLPTSSVYIDYKEKARQLFPILSEVEFQFTDETDARLDADFLTDFLLTNSHGVIIKIKPINVTSEVITELPVIDPQSSLFDINAKSATSNQQELEYCIGLSDEDDTKKSRLDVNLVPREIFSKEKLLEIVKNASCRVDSHYSYPKNH